MLSVKCFDRKSNLSCSFVENSKNENQLNDQNFHIKYKIFLIVIFIPNLTKIQIPTLKYLFNHDIWNELYQTRITGEKGNHEVICKCNKYQAIIYQTIST